MPDRYFPITTDPACQLKWTWSTIHLYDGFTNSCHRVNKTKLDLDSFDNFHNTEKKLNDRKLMLQGQWPAGGCEYCQNVEQAGGVSDRIFQRQIPNLVPPELETDPTAIKVTPRIIEVYLDNVCNMSCIYCWDGFSSQIQAENNRFGEFQKEGVVIKNHSKKSAEFEQMSDKFWQWMSANYPTIRRLHILGGEPFFQKQFETCLTFLESNTNPELEFNVISNLKVPLSRLSNFVERIKRLVTNGKIKRFDITASIDCWGAEQEYIRYGIDLTDWQKNFEYLVNQSWITLNINQTITGLGMKSMPDLIDYVNRQRSDGRTIGHYFMACVNRPHLYPGIFGAGFFDQDFDRILSSMPNDTWQHKHAYSMMKGLQLEFNTKSRNPLQIKNLNIFLDEIDRRRGLSWKNTFPWLEKEFSSVV